MQAQRKCDGSFIIYLYLRMFMLKSLLEVATTGETGPNRILRGLLD